MQHLLRNALVRSCLGEPKSSSGVPVSTIWPWSMKTTRLATWRAKFISWVTQTVRFRTTRSLERMSSPGRKRLSMEGGLAMPQIASDGFGAA